MCVLVWVFACCAGLGFIVGLRAVIWLLGGDSVYVVFVRYVYLMVWFFLLDGFICIFSRPIPYAFIVITLSVI